MKKIMVVVAAVGGLSCMPACAAPMYAFNFTTSTPLIGGPVTGTGVFTTSDVSTVVGGQTAFAITSITGTVNGSAINAPAGSYGNYFTTGPSFLDGTGLRFFTASGIDVRFFFQDVVGQYRVNTFSPGSSSFVTATSAAVAVPEPATWSLLASGMALIGLAFLLAKGKALPQAQAA